MLRTEWFFAFGLVLALVDAQHESAAKPRPSRPPKLTSSYSDFPGSPVFKNPMQINNAQNTEAPTRVPSRVIKQFGASIVIPAASRNYGSIPSNLGPKPAATQSNSYSGVPKSVQGIPVAAVAASELAQGIAKPKPPLTTGTDTWTPMGYTGNGKRFEVATGSASQQLPYDVNKSKQTIGEHIIQRQQKQQQQQQQQQPEQYDLFGFPINNSPGIPQSEVMQNKHDLLEIITLAIDAKTDRHRHPRHAARIDANGIVYDSAKHSHPPKPPAEIDIPVKRRRPPPPPALKEEMFQNQYQTQHPRDKSQSSYSNLQPIVETAKANSPAESASPYIDTQSNNEKVVEPIIKHNLKPIPVTPSGTTLPQPTKPPYAPGEQTGSAKPPSGPKLKTAYKPTGQEHGPSEALANQHEAVPSAEGAEGLSEILHAEAALELQALLDYAQSSHGHMHSLDHQHNAHTHAHPRTQKVTQSPTINTYKATPKTVSTKPPPTYNKPQTTKPPATTKADSNGPPAELEAQFSSMFNAWYNAKFGASKSTTTTTTSAPKYPTVKRKQPKSKGILPGPTLGPRTNSIDKNALFKEFMTMFQDHLYASEPTTASPTKSKYVPPSPKPTKSKYVPPSPKPTIAKYLPPSPKPTQAKYVSPSPKPTEATYIASKTKPTEPPYVTSKPSSAHKASPKKYKSGSPEAKPTNVKYGPRKPGAYATPTTAKTPTETGPANVIVTLSPIEMGTTVDPLTVELVNMTHPENLSIPLPETSGTVPSETGLPGEHQRSRKVLTRKPKGTIGTTTMRPVVDPDILADVNEARVGQGLSPLTANQVDLQGNLLPFYKRQMRIGRLPARHHPLHNLGMQHQHQMHEHQHLLPQQYQMMGRQHQHPEQGMVSGFSNFPHLYPPHLTNSGIAMAYTPFPRPRPPPKTPAVAGPTPKPIASAKPKAATELLAAPEPAAAPSAAMPGQGSAEAQVPPAGFPLNPLALFYFYNALTNMIQNQPQPVPGGEGTMYQHQHRNMPINGLNGIFNQIGLNGLFNQNSPNNGRLGPNQYTPPGQLPHNNGNGEHAMANPHNLDLHHQAIHMEAGHAMTPNLHRQVHRLLRNRQHYAQRRNLFGPMMPNRPAVTPNPALFDPDLYADMLEAQQNARAAALAG